MSSEWSYTIGDVCGVGDGAHSKVKRLNQGILYLTSKNIGVGKLIKLDEADFISESDYEKLFPINSKSVKFPHAGDILIGIIGSFGNSYIYKDIDKFGFSSSIGILRPNKEIIDSQYLYYVINSKKFQAFNSLYNTGSVQGYTNMSTVKNLPIPLQSLPTQKKIAHILSALDDKIELNRKMNQTLEAMASAIFKSWFVDFDPVHAKANCEGEAELENIAKELGISKAILDLFPSEFIESELGMIPKGWEVKTLNSICKLITKGTTPNKSDLERANDDASIPFIKVKDITNNGEINRENLENIPNSIHVGSLKRSILEKNDLLFSIAGTIGRIAVVDNDLANSNTNQALGIIRLKDTEQYLNFVWLSLKSDGIQNNIFSKVVQGVQANTSLTNLRDIQIIFPTFDILAKWNNIADGLIEKFRNNQTEIRTLQKTRDTLLPKLLSGEIDVSELEIK